MFCLEKPNQAILELVLKRDSSASLTYKEVGITREGKFSVSGFRPNCVALELGEGEECFNRAVSAMKNWKHFDVDGIFVYPERPPLAVGTVVAVCANHFLMWSINTCRVLYVIDDTDGEVRRFGYGYGTLPAHSEIGEERFLLKWDTNTNKVWYEILAFSRSNNLIVTLGWPVACVIQDQFRVNSVAALRRNLQTKS